MVFIRNWFSGRLGRLHFALLAFLGIVFNATIGGMILHVLFQTHQVLGPILSFIAGIPLLLAIMQLFVRRFHDVGLSWWWTIPMYLPYVGGLASLITYVCLVIMPGESEENEYGAPTGSVRDRSMLAAFLNRQ
jgi:uncharacterized membrane protein YhaH (DUF805 family)